MSGCCCCDAGGAQVGMTPGLNVVPLGQSVRLLGGGEIHAREPSGKLINTVPLMQGLLSCVWQCTGDKIDRASVITIIETNIPSLIRFIGSISHGLYRTALRRNATRDGDVMFGLDHLVDQRSSGSESNPALLPAGGYRQAGE